jgi:membrane protein implicated in regulation of membrane protease activity
MTLSTVWWLVAGGLIAAELLTGTFYLLMLSLGAGAAALAAYSGVPLTGQMIVGGVVGALAVTLWHLRNDRPHAHNEASRDPNLHLDLGETVKVTEWDAEGVALVKHRGAQWTALLAPGHIQTTGAYRIVEIVGSRLMIEKI